VSRSIGPAIGPRRLRRANEIPRGDPDDPDEYSGPGFAVIRPPTHLSRGHVSDTATRPVPRRRRVQVLDGPLARYIYDR